MAFASIPPGFFAANEVLNELPGELLSRMIGDGQRYIRRQVDSMPTEEYAKMAPAGASLASVRSATNAVVYILRQLSLSKAEGKAASALLESETDLNEAARAAFSETGAGCHAGPKVEFYTARSQRGQARRHQVEARHGCEFKHVQEPRGSIRDSFA